MSLKTLSLFPVPIIVAFAPTAALHECKGNGVAIVELDARPTLQTLKEFSVRSVIFGGRKSVECLYQ